MSEQQREAIENGDLSGEGGEGAESVTPTIEEVARKMGYRSKEEMKDPSKHVDAATYILNTGKFKESYQQEIKHLKRSMDGITATISQVAVQKHAEGVKEAEQRLSKAKAEFDPDAVEQATLALQQAKAAAPANDVPPEVNEWCERNPWFDTDKGMKADALEYRAKFIKANPDASVSEALEYIEKKIRKDYPDAFTDAKEQRKAPAAGPEGVRSVNSTGKEKWEQQEKELSTYERDTMNALCGQMHNGKPIMTKKTYIENLAQSGRFGR